MLPFLKCVISQSCSFNNHLLSPQGLNALLGTGYTTLETTSLRPERWYTVGKAAGWNCSRHLVWKSYSPRIPSHLALNTTHATVGIKFNVSCWGHFLSHELSQNPGVFVARKSEAALACSSRCRGPCGPLLWLLWERLWLPAFCYSHQPPMRVPTGPGCFGVGRTAFPTSKEAFTPTAFCAWELLSFLAQTPLPSFQNISFHSFLPVPPQTPSNTWEMRPSLRPGLEMAKVKLPWEPGDGNPIFLSGFSVSMGIKQKCILCLCHPIT